MEKKDNKKTWAIVGTVAAILLCGCPGLSMCVAGALTIFGQMPDVVNGYGYLPSGWGWGLLCLAVIFVAIAVVVPVLTLRKKKEPKAEEPAADVLPPSEPLPPAS
jgi:hypothetical protein